jgi:hypothetical protein
MQLHIWLKSTYTDMTYSLDILYYITVSTSFALRRLLLERDEHYFSETIQSHSFAYRGC